MAVEPRFLLDTNIFILILDAGIPALRSRIEDSDKGSLVTSTIVLAEVLRGIPASDRRANDRFDALLALAPALPFDQAAARVYARLPFFCGGFDRLIGAHALALDLTVVTANPRDFHGLPDLRVEDWTKP